MQDILRPEKMHCIRIYGMKKNREEIMQEIQKLGVLHVSESDAPLPQAAAEEAELIHSAVKNTEMIDKMKSLFDEARAPLSTYFEEEHERVGLAGYTDGAFMFWSNKCVLRIYNEFEKISSLERTTSKRISDANKTKELLSHFCRLKAPIESLGGGKYVFTGIGKLKKDAGKIPDDFFIEVEDTTKDGEMYVFFSAPNEKKADVQKYISVLDIGERGTVREAIEKQGDAIKGAKAMEKSIEEKKREFRKNKPLILAIEERWNNIKAREAACRDISETGATFSVEGWIPQGACTSCISIKNAVVYSCEEKGFAPTKLKNPKIFEPFETLTRNYGLPKYKEIDPTIFTAIAFTVFFGFMFMDIAYSVMLVPFSILMIKKGTKQIKELGHMFLLGSVSGTVFGILGGSALGNFISFNSYLDAYKKPFALIFYALLIGTVHLNLGIATKLFESKRKKDSEGMKDSLSWFALESGTLALGLSAIYSKYLAIPAAVFIVWAIRVRLKDGFAGIIGAIDFFGNIMSYIRLMALALLTSWIAFVINLITGIISGFSLGGAALFFSLGHFVNFILNIVSSSLHSLRLNYVEFFGTFYDGGGTEYRPLGMQNEYHKTL